MDLSIKDIVQLFVQGGVGVIMLIVWYYTRADGNKKADAANALAAEARKQTDKAIEVAQRAVEAANKTTEEAFRKSNAINDALFQHITSEQEDRTLLTGILERLTIKLDTPAQCPLLISGKKFKLEVTE